MIISASEVSRGRKPGIWGKSPSILSNFEIGTMLPQVDWAVNEKNYGVLIMNPGTNSEEEPFEDMCEHALYVWDRYVTDSGFDRIFLLVFAAGGDCLISLQKKFSNTFYDQVKQIALADSWLIDLDELEESH